MELVILLIVHICITLIALTSQWKSYTDQIKRYVYNFSTIYFIGIIIFCITPFFNIIPLIDGIIYYSVNYVEHYNLNDKITEYIRKKK
jgi:hypothetical protein